MAPPKHIYFAYFFILFLSPFPLFFPFGRPGHIGIKVLGTKQLTYYVRLYLHNIRRSCIIKLKLFMEPGKIKLKQNKNWFLNLLSLLLHFLRSIISTRFITVSARNAIPFYKLD